MRERTLRAAARAHDGMAKLQYVGGIDCGLQRALFDPHQRIEQVVPILAPCCNGAVSKYALLVVLAVGAGSAGIDEPNRHIAARVSDRAESGIQGRDRRPVSTVEQIDVRADAFVRRVRERARRKFGSQGWEEPHRCSGAFEFADQRRDTHFGIAEQHARARWQDGVRQ